MIGPAGRASVDLIGADPRLASLGGPLLARLSLRALAFEERRKMHDLLMEGLDMVFKQRGLRSIEDLTGKQV